MTWFNQNTTTLSKALLTAGLLGGAALSTLGAGSAQAVQTREECKFGAFVSLLPSCSGINWTLGDKTLTNFSFDPTIPVGGPPDGVFSFIWDDLGAPC
jgi:hypothetical protein